MAPEEHLYKIFLSDKTSFRVMYIPWAYFLKKLKTLYVSVFPWAISLMQEELQQVNNNTGALRDVGMEHEGKRLTLYTFGSFYLSKQTHLFLLKF